jgi:ketosteroid isomerase-like protein
MKKFLGLFFFCLCVSLAVQAQSKEEKALTVAVEKLREAMVEADKKALETLLAPELSYGHSAGKMEDKAAFIESLVSGKSDFTNIDLTEQTITVVGNTALVRHHLAGLMSDAGKIANVNLGVLLVWQKQQGQWKLIARQAFKL